ncbi:MULTISPECIES: hypothetical protein [Pseudomonas]|uniref:hypothetical protein n=1 Tax=Pseudomonas TaxID=286 RepID=UPI001C0A7FC1|nr:MULTISPECIES: hypothetical protein [Pseudomonas]
MKIRTLLTPFFVFFYFTSNLALAEGELMVMPASTKVFNSHEQKVKLRNMGDSTLYLSINLQKVINPGLAPEKKVALAELAHPELISSPDKLSLGPNQTRVVTLKSLVEPDQESLYRLYIVPVRSLRVEDAPQDKITAPMSVSIGYGVLIRHMPSPKNQHVAWTYRCEKGGLTLVNNGNVRQLFTRVVVGESVSEQTIAVFPGVPRHFKSSRINLSVEDQPQSLVCP